MKLKDGQDDRMRDERIHRSSRIFHPSSLILPPSSFIAGQSPREEAKTRCLAIWSARA